MGVCVLLLLLHNRQVLQRRDVAQSRLLFRRNVVKLPYFAMSYRQRPVARNVAGALLQSFLHRDGSGRNLKPSILPSRNPLGGFPLLAGGLPFRTSRSAAWY